MRLLSKANFFVYFQILISWKYLHHTHNYSKILSRSDGFFITKLNSSQTCEAKRQTLISQMTPLPPYPKLFFFCFLYLPKVVFYHKSEFICNLKLELKSLGINKTIHVSITLEHKIHMINSMWEINDYYWLFKIGWFCHAQILLIILHITYVLNFT